MSASSNLALKQRSDYTHKFNRTSGRHGWLRLTPAYSVKVVEEIIALAPQAERVFDPFCGTGTTALSAASHGRDAGTTDINPFLVWLARAKVAEYSVSTLAETQSAAKTALEYVRTGATEAVVAPPIHNIERWWSPSNIRFLCALRGAIDAVGKDNQGVKDLLLIAFCRTLISLSNAAFNHQSMSFKSADAQLDIVRDTAAIYHHDVLHVVKGAQDPVLGSASVYLQDARELSANLGGKYDLLVTSPPYANRMSYIRELRPYMYWLGYLNEAREAGELDWLAIGGTWGLATSRLKDWSPTTGRTSNDRLSEALEGIRHADNANGDLLATYVHKYCDDMHSHFASVGNLLRPGAEVHYVVGNSTFYGMLVSVEKIYSDMMLSLGFDGVEIKPLRKRNSKKELVEFDVSAVWGG